TPDNFTSEAAVLPSFARGDASDISHPLSGSVVDTKAYVAALKEDSQWAEARLAYVALTRAKERLVVSWHQWRPRRKGSLGPGRYADLLADMLGTVWPDFGERPDDDIQAGTPWPVFAKDVGHGLIDNTSRSVDDPGQADRVKAWRT
ncbi:ATP-dependent helicase, partial [Actinomadura sp. DSM 109109]|nr:ATP-dependent helicase [Actinomadura lepetitiana]